MTNAENRHSDPKMHPDPELLRDYAAGRPMVADFSTLEMHLSTCEFCVETIAAFDSTHLLTSRIGDALRSEHKGKNDTERSFEQIKAMLSPSEDAAAIGQLGVFELLELIGRGAFGFVFRATDQTLRRTVAVKVLSPEFAPGSQARQRFLREARAVAALQHENVVRIHTVADAPLPYLVMEYSSGETLQQRIEREGELLLVEAIEIGRQTAQGLAAVHRLGLIHRDIKPANILLEASESSPASEQNPLQVRVTDFGLARATDETAGVTTERLIMGTPAFMSPEQAAGERLDARSDLFSLGSVLYTLCAGRPPFEAPTLAGVLRKVADVDCLPIELLVPTIPASLATVIRRLMANSPADRFASAEDAAKAIAACSAFDPPARRNSRLKDRRMVLGGLMSLLALAAVVFVRTNNTEFVLTTDDPDISTRIAQAGGLLVEDRLTQQKYSLQPGSNRLPNGDYELVVTTPAGLDLTASKFQLRRFGGAVRITVTAREMTPAESTSADTAAVSMNASATESVSAANPDPMAVEPDRTVEWLDPEHVPFVDGNVSGSNACVSGDGLRIVFTSRRAENHGRLFEASRTTLDDPFGVPQQFPQLIFDFDQTPVPHFVGTPWLSSDGLILLLYTLHPRRQSGMDLWQTTRASFDDPWQPLKRLEGGASTPVTEYAPSMTADGLTIACFRPEPDNAYDGDLWIATRQAVTDDFTSSRKLGPPVNTTASEQHPFLLPDGLSMLFDRGTPDPRLVIARRKSLNEDFTDLRRVNLPASWNDRMAYAPSLTSDGKLLIFTSNLVPGREGFETGELWQAKRK